MIRLDEKQYRAVKKMTRAACANNDCGNCLLLDDGGNLRLCAEYQLFAAMPLFPRSGITRRQAALRTDHPQRGTDLKRCAVCGSTFAAGSNRAKYCPDCAAKIRRRQKAQSERNRRLRIKNNYIASTANEYPFARNARASHRERGHFACWDSPKPLYDRERT